MNRIYLMLKLYYLKPEDKVQLKNFGLKVIPHYVILEDNTFEESFTYAIKKIHKIYCLMFIPENSACHYFPEDYYRNEKIFDSNKNIYLIRVYYSNYANRLIMIKEGESSVDCMLRNYRYELY